MEYNTVYEQVVGAVAAVFKKEREALAGTESYEELGADELDMFELVLKLEDTFAIEITDEEFDALTSIAQTVTFVCEKKGLEQ